MAPSSSPRRPLPRRQLNERAAAAVGAIALALASVAGCRDATTSFGPTPAAAESSARELFTSLAERFTNVQRAPKFAKARGKLGRYALTPSKIYDDSSIWLAPPGAATSDGGGTRVLTLQGAYAAGRYFFAPVADPPLPARLGDSRHAMRLRRLADPDEYEWTTDVEHAVGGLRAASIENLYTALVASAVRLGPLGDGAFRASYRGAFPRTSATLGQLFSVDGVRATPGSDGATSVVLTIGIRPDGLRARYPAFADYATKYVVPTRVRFALRDARGARWMEGAAAERTITLHLRATADGRMVPLDAPPRPMPDSLTLAGELFTHILLFDVGVSDLRASFTVLRTPHERGWLLRFATQPEWHLPLATRYLIRAPLRRPFANGGALLRLAVRDSAGAQTLVTRHGTMAVRESAILRFLGALGFTAMSDFTGESETEENRFNADVFNAMRADATALGPAGGGGGGGAGDAAAGAPPRAP